MIVITLLGSNTPSVTRERDFERENEKNGLPKKRAGAEAPTQPYSDAVIRI